MEEVIKEKEKKCQLENIPLVVHTKCSYIIDCSVVQYSTKPKEGKYISVCFCVLLLNIHLKN